MLIILIGRWKPSCTPNAANGAPVREGMPGCLSVISRYDLKGMSYRIGLLSFEKAWSSQEADRFLGEGATASP
ncbi:MAG TPA: hypothetical protein VG099_33280 [Gemmataceae bacterium]|nr:hypothetical protein [Gemmataceae bacterium]